MFCLHKFGRKAVGIFFLLLVVFIWVASSELIQFIFTRLSYDSPFFLTYYSTSLFSIYLVGFLFKKDWRDMLSSNHGYRNEKELQYQDGYREIDEDHVRGNVNKIPIVRILKLALSICPFWFAANWAFNKSLDMTLVEDVTLLSSTSSLWTLIFSAVFLKERMTIKKFASVVACIGGVAMITGFNMSSIWGNLMAVGSAVCYGVYTVMLKYRIPDESNLSMPLLFGCVGLCNGIIMWPLLFILNVAGIEPLSLPKSNVLLFLTVNGVVGTVLSDVLWAKAVLLTSPLVATLALSLTIPVSIVADFIIGNRVEASWHFFVGCILIIVSFVVANIGDDDKNNERKEEETDDVEETDPLLLDLEE